MVFCNTKAERQELYGIRSHNPYFNRWFSAIAVIDILTAACISHNPYFNRWFSAISKMIF